MKKSPRPTETGEQRHTARAGRPMTKRQLSRHKREQMLQRYLKIGFGTLFGLILLVIALGYWREQIAPGGEAILHVRGVPITTQTYAKVLGFRQYMLDRQIASLQSFARQQPSGGNDDQSNDFLQQFVQQQLSQLEQQRATLEQQIIAALADDELVRQEAAKRGIVLTAEEMESELIKRRSPEAAQANEQSGGDATASAEATPAADATPPAPTATPVPPEEVLATMRAELGELGLLTEDEYKELILKPEILRDRLEAQLQEAVPTTAEQVWARHILVEQEEQAKDVLAKLQGGADFAALARELSQDTSNKEQGGDLGWFTRGAMVAPFEEAAFSLQVGQTVTEPVQTTFGYHVIEVLGHEQERPLSEDQLTTAKENALEEWLRPQRNDEKIVRYDFSFERARWASIWIAQNAKYLQSR